MYVKCQESASKSVLYKACVVFALCIFHCSVANMVLALWASCICSVVEWSVCLVRNTTEKAMIPRYLQGKAILYVDTYKDGFLVRLLAGTV